MRVIVDNEVLNVSSGKASLSLINRRGCMADAEVDWSLEYVSPHVYELKIRRGDEEGDRPTKKSVEENILTPNGIEGIVLDEIDYIFSLEPKEQMNVVDRATKRFPGDIECVRLLFDTASGRCTDDQGVIKYTTEKLFLCVQKYIDSDIRMRYPTYRQHWEDMQQSAYSEFIAEISNYDPDRAKPTVFVQMHIKHAVTEYLSQMVEGQSVHYMQIVRLLSSTANKLRNIEGEQAVTPDRLASMLPGLSKEQVIQNFQYIPGVKYVSINDDESLLELPAKEDTPQDQIIKKDYRERIMKLLKESLTEEELMVMSFFKGDERKANETCERFNISANKLKRMQTRVMQKLTISAKSGAYGDDIMSLVKRLSFCKGGGTGITDAEKEETLLIFQNEDITDDNEEELNSIVEVSFDENEVATDDYNFDDDEKDYGVEIPTF